MHSSGGSGKIKAQAYLQSSIDAKSKRSRRTRVLKGKKAKKVKKDKTMKEAAAELFRVTVSELVPTVNGRCDNSNTNRVTGSPTAAVHNKPSSTHTEKQFITCYPISNRSMTHQLITPARFTPDSKPNLPRSSSLAVPMGP